LGAIRLHLDTAARVAIVSRQPPAGSRFVASIHPEAFFFEPFLRSPHVGCKRRQLRFKYFGTVVLIRRRNACKIFVRSNVNSANRRGSKNADRGCNDRQPCSSIRSTDQDRARCRAKGHRGRLKATRQRREEVIAVGEPRFAHEIHFIEQVTIGKLSFHRPETDRPGGHMSRTRLFARPEAHCDRGPEGSLLTKAAATDGKGVYRTGNAWMLEGGTGPLYGPQGLAAEPRP
jgi:hypothetical protein